MTYHQRTDNKFYCFYVNNCLMDAFSGMMSWFSESYYNAFKHCILGGYDKAIREIKTHLKNGEQSGALPLPSISLNPFGDLAVDPKFPQLWRVPSVGTNLASLYLDPLYEDEYFGFSVIANRFTGNFEVIIYCNSPYEYLDFFVQTLMWFHGGFNRRVRPGLISTNCIIPDEVVETAYEDAPYDWTKSGLKKEFVKSMNGNYYLFPINIGPQIWLTGVSNASTVYGEDDVASYKLQITVEYDIDLPTHVIVKSNDRIRNMNIHLSTSDPVFVPEIKMFDSDENTLVDDNPNMKLRPEDVLGDSKYFRRVKQQEYQRYMFAPETAARPCSASGCSRSNTTLEHACTLSYKFDKKVTKEDEFIIDFSSFIPYRVSQYDMIMIGNKEFGVLVYGTDYEVDLNETGSKIKVLTNVEPGTMWDIYVYKEQE